MPLIVPQKIDTKVDAVEQALEKIQLYLWETVTENDTCQELELPEFSDKTIQVLGSFGGGNISIEGSIMKDSPAFSVLNDPNGNALTKTSAAVEAVLENVWKIRPKVPTGTSVDIDVYLLVK
ncbi:hypothetical protein LCGC14_1634860 [marine sediment metagenome]|uniref:Uncharacterized protein n=1 Tax=marine sediment metagenome TaxID=412755 RepID=A0A0F9I1I1_9ZZZZ